MLPAGPILEKETSACRTTRLGVVVPYRDQTNLQPAYRQHTVPCKGEVGDLWVLTPLGEGDQDPSIQGLASLWFCTRADDSEEPAVWARVQFDGVAICKMPQIKDPPQDRPILDRG